MSPQWQSGSTVCSDQLSLSWLSAGAPDSFPMAGYESSRLQGFPGAVNLSQPLLYSRGSSATMHHRTQQSPGLPQQMASQLDASHCPAQPPGGLQARHQEAGQTATGLLGASLSRSPVPNCPLRSDPSLGGCTPSGRRSRRVKWPITTTGRWEPTTAIFNLIKAVSTIDFSSFNY